MYPLAALRFLSADIDHEHFVIAQRECSFGDTNCARATLDDVLLYRLVLRIEQAVECRVKVEQTRRRSDEVN